jgi:hypothetical protein
MLYWLLPLAHAADTVTATRATFSSWIKRYGRIRGFALLPLLPAELCCIGSYNDMTRLML